MTRREAKKLATQPKSTRSRPSKSVSLEAGTKSSDKTATSSKTVSTTHSEFARIVVGNGVLDPQESVPPINLAYYQSELDRARESEPPTLEEYEDYLRSTGCATNETAILMETSMLLKRPGLGYHTMYNQALSDFPRDVGFNTGLSPAQPDMIQGLVRQSYKPFPVMEVLDAALPKHSLPLSQATALPQLAGEFKGPQGDLLQAQVQASYDGACMVYGRNQARSYLETPDPTGHAYVQTFTTNGDKLDTFAHYASISRGKVKYHQHTTSTTSLTTSYEQFEKGRRRLRNMQDLSKRHSEDLRDELVGKWERDQPPDDFNDSVIPGFPSLPRNSDEDVDQSDHSDQPDPRRSLLSQKSVTVDPRETRSRRKTKA